MTVYRITISLGGPKRYPITDWLVSIVEAKRVVEQTHPSLDPVIEVEGRGEVR